MKVGGIDTHESQLVTQVCILNLDPPDLLCGGDVYFVGADSLRAKVPKTVKVTGSRQQFYLKEIIGDTAYYEGGEVVEKPWLRG
jgi:hypothetical protein